MSVMTLNVRKEHRAMHSPEVANKKTVAKLFEGRGGMRRGVCRRAPSCKQRAERK